MRTVAAQVIAGETSGGSTLPSGTAAAFHDSEQLGPQLTALLGHTGFRALTSRALALAGPEVPWLRSVQVKADGSIEGLDALEAQVPPQAIAEARLVLLTHLLELLVAFIGAALTMRLVHEVWPQPSLNNSKVENRSLR